MQTRQITPLVNNLVQLLIENLVDQAALAGTGNSGNTDQPAQWEGHVYILEIVLFSAFDLYGLSVPLAPFLGIGHDFAAAEIGTGQGIGVGFNLGNGASGHYLSAMLPGSRAKVSYEIRRPHHGFVVLNNQYRVAQVFQAQQGIDQSVVVVGMQAHRGLIADVKHAGQTGTDLRGKADALGFTSGKGPGGAVHGYVVKADTLQEVDPPLNLFQDLVSNGLLSGGQHPFGMGAGSVWVDVSDPFRCLANVLGANIHDAETADLNCQCFWPQAFAVTGWTRTRRHITLYLGAHVVRLGPLVASLQVGNDALKVGIPFVGLSAASAVPHGDLLFVISVEN